MLLALGAKAEYLDILFFNWWKLPLAVCLAHNGCSSNVGMT